MMSAWVADQQLSVKNASTPEYKVRMKIAFVLKSSRMKDG
jgi:flavin-binding protein dodecin